MDVEEKYICCRSCQYRSKHPIFGTWYHCYPQGYNIEEQDLDNTTCFLHDIAIKESSSNG